ncbi:hypothetical protein IQ266_20740 [filamentous cyanobacterium LEGE 11480]|uniref:Uncharacterized protein n=1 Tax=Romeriopsis navalis LEGE 11480 TaxID=2777977 RepID=A0A928VTA4_9CYAN|nr:hypothetical protein [Romeriopsis navalis]MBE9032170.1 hypothetical protein [Romeriopsis navalis LEGE 11480]
MSQGKPAISHPSNRLIASVLCLTGVVMLADAVPAIAQASTVAKSPAVRISNSPSEISQTEITPSNRIVNRSMATFWPAAQKILESQAQWFDRAEVALSTPDPLVNQILSTKLLIQLRSMDLFVQRYYRNPRGLCQSQRSSRLLGAAVGFDAAQTETYCAIYKLSRDLTPLRSRLTQRSSLFNRRWSSTALPLFSTQSRQMPLTVTTVEQFNLTSRIASQTPSQVFIYPQMVGIQRMKQLQANYRPEVAPAIAPPTDLIKQVNQGRDQLVKIQAGLPISTQSLAAKSIQLFRPKRQSISKFAVRTTEADVYQTFLAQPNTGIARVYPVSAFVVDRNRLNPANVPMPFGLRVEAGQFLLSGEALNYGFITQLGDISLDQMNAAHQLPELFKTYSPPNVLAEIQNHQRRFLVGKDTPLSSEIPAQLKQTYVMRLVQYQLPEVVTTGRPLQPGERGQLKSLLAHQGQDRLIAFRPVTQRRDGSYTVLWKVLETKAAPQIRDLENYISASLKTRTRY